MQVPRFGANVRYGGVSSSAGAKALLPGLNFVTESRRTCAVASRLLHRQRLNRIRAIL